MAWLIRCRQSNAALIPNLSVYSNLVCMIIPFIPDVIFMNREVLIKPFSETTDEIPDANGSKLVPFQFGAEHASNDRWRRSSDQRCAWPIQIAQFAFWKSYCPLAWVRSDQDKNHTTLRWKTTQKAGTGQRVKRLWPCRFQTLISIQIGKICFFLHSDWRSSLIDFEYICVSSILKG